PPPVGAMAVLLRIHHSIRLPPPDERSATCQVVLLGRNKLAVERLVAVSRSRLLFVCKRSPAHGRSGTDGVLKHFCFAVHRYCSSSRRCPLSSASTAATGTTTRRPRRMT